MPSRLSILDEICWHSLNFVRSCIRIRHESALVQFIALHGLHARSRSLFGWNVVFCAERFNCSINDLIYGHLPIIINFYVCNSVYKTTLDRVAFLRELIMIQNSSLTLSIQRRAERRYFARLHELVGFLVRLFSCCILYFVCDLIINN